MKLTQDTIRKLIQEEISLYETEERLTIDTASRSLATTLAGYAGAGLNIDSIIVQAKRILDDPSVPTPANRQDLSGIAERKLTAPEKEKREEVAQAMEEEDPNIDMSKKMAIATAQAKKNA